MAQALVLMVALVATGSCASASPQSNSGKADIRRIQSLFERGEIDAAEKQVWAVVTREPENPAAINLLGAIRTTQQRYLEAEALFKRALVIAPDFIAAYRNLGDLYVVQKRRDEAKIVYLKAHEIAPLDAKVSLALGNIYEETGEFQRSLDIFDSIPATQRSADALPILASDYLALKQSDKVAALIPQLRRAAASDPSLTLRFSRVLLENGFVDDAADLLKAATPRQKGTPEYLLVLARVQESQGDVALAQRTLERAFNLDSHSFDALFQAARLASQLKDYTKELALLVAALKIQPDHVEALRHLVFARMRSGDAVGAIPPARRLYALHPQDPDSVYPLGAALANHAEWHEARPIIEKLVSLRDDATANVMLGMTLMNDGDIDGASKHVERALQLNPKETEAHYYKGVIDRQRANLPEAMKEMEMVVLADPKHALAQVELGTLALQMGDLDRARLALEQAVSLSPEIPENHYQLALAYSRLGLQDKARAQMSEFQKLKAAVDHAKNATSNGATVGAKPPS